MANDRFLNLAGPGRLSPKASRRFIAYAIDQSRLLPMITIESTWRWRGLSSMDVLIMATLAIWAVLLIAGMLLGAR